METKGPVITATETAGKEIYENVSPQTITDLRGALLYMRADDRDLWQTHGAIV